MYVRQVVLQNVRGFDRLDFDFQREAGRFAGWTVITGDNGSGKSALLRAIAVVLVGVDAARALQPSFSGWVRHGAGQALIDVEVEQNDLDRPAGSGRWPKGPFRATVGLTPGERDVSLTPSSEPPEAASRSIWSPNASGWFSCGYGPFRRVFGASPEATRRMVSASTARFVTMFDEAASLSEADQWMRRLQYQHLENHATAGSTLDLLRAIMDDGFLPNGMVVDGINSGGLWLRDQAGIRLSWSDMSDGYRAALALTADIIRHLVDCYGIDDLGERGSDGRMRITRGGVVLIDEIDAHLRPEWQREIGFWLKDRFPLIQFIVTTHSPIICQAADANGLFVLSEPGSGERPTAASEEERRRIIAARPDTILLSSAFRLANTRSEPIVRDRAEYARLSAKARSRGALTEVEASRYGQLRLSLAQDEEP
jgi:energy-coupling factor transporter ATP-binding protein EcfA2